MVKYSGCPRAYKHHYIDGYRSYLKSSALLFGSAIDAACNHMLENFEFLNVRGEVIRDEALSIFREKWLVQEDRDSGTIVNIRENANIKYFKNDFDSELLDSDDLSNFTDIHETMRNREMVEDALKNGADWLSLDENLRLEYNLANWLSLNKKGNMMLLAYYYEILPKFKRILTLQRKLELLDDEGNMVNGIAEFVAELPDGRICLVDNKTSASPYDDSSVRNSQQLALYKQILDIQKDDDKYEWSTKIDVAAYAVMGKKIVRERVCLSCSHNANGTHKTCNAVINDKRCGGAWGVTYKATTQFIIDKISDKFGNAVLENASNIITCVEKGIFPKNFDRCSNDFGGKCPFFNKCHHSDETDLFKLPKKENDVKK